MSLRERNIARNESRLRALGLLTGVGDNDAAERRDGKNGEKRCAKRKRPPAAAVTAALPTRRSGRLRKPVGSTGEGAPEAHRENGAVESIDGAGDGGGAAMEEAEEQFTVSPLIDFQMASGGLKCSAAESGIETLHGINDEVRATGGAIGVLVPSGPRLAPSAGLSRLIADARFLSSSGGNGSLASNASASVLRRLLTAGNDGTVCHWDLTSTSVATGAPKLLATKHGNKQWRKSSLQKVDIFLVREATNLTQFRH